MLGRLDGRNAVWDISGDGTAWDSLGRKGYGIGTWPSIQFAAMRGRRFDAVMLILCSILVVGGHVLVWADSNGFITGNELFSLWALPLYVGFGLAAYVLLLWWIPRRAARRKSPGDGPEPILPAGYQAALVGAVLFIVGLIVEFAARAIGSDLPAGPESVLSPSRIALFGGALLLLSGPIASVAGRLRDETPGSHSNQDSLLLSVGLGLSLAVVTLLTGFVHPFVVKAGAPAEDTGPIQTTTDLYLVRLDGPSSRLTSTPADYEAKPDVSADGSRVTFARGQPDDYRVYTMSIGGTDALRLTDGNVHEDGPLWMPGATTISFWSPVEGSGAAPTTGPAPAPGPAASARPVDLGGLGIWTVGTSGGLPRLMSSRGGEGIESFAADGKAFCGWTFESGSFDVATGDFTARTRSTVVTGPTQEWSCSLSPDGTRIFFHSDRDGDFDIYSVARDGSDLRQLTDDPGIDQLPRISPDGTRLAFISSRTGEFELYVGNADLTDVRDVSNDPALDDGFLGIAWLPDGSGLVAASSGRHYPVPASEQTTPLGVASLVLQAMLLALALTIAFRLDPGTTGVATVIGVIAGVLSAFVSGEIFFAVAPMAAGLAVDFVAARYPDWKGVSLSLLVAIVGSTVFLVGYFVVLLVTRGIGWSLDLVLGSTILAILFAAAVGAIASDRGEPEEVATIPFA